MGCAAALFLGFYLLGRFEPSIFGGWRAPLVAAFGLALSSTAIALQVMGERNLLPTSSGQAAFSILLFQDVAAIPILALLPLLAASYGGNGVGSKEHLQSPMNFSTYVERVPSCRT